MTEEVREKIRQIVELINQGNLNLPMGYDWGDITGGFDKEVMEELLCNICDDEEVSNTINRISRAWEYAWSHSDWICYHDNGRPKYNDTYTIEYVLGKIRKKRNLNNALELCDGTRGTHWLNSPRNEDLSTMDKDEAEETQEPPHDGEEEELCHFIHPRLDDEGQRQAHEEIKNLVAHHQLKDIISYLKSMVKENRILLPQSADNAYKELVRMGMPQKGKGFSIKTFYREY